MEKTQVIVIHGGSSFLEDKDFYEYLKRYKIDFTYSQNKDWKSNLQEDLEDKFEVIKPTMPNKQKADYNAWKIWFEKYFEIIKSKKVILIGHSLGGIFLAKYLSENNFPQEIYGLYFVAAVFDHRNDKELGNFSLNYEKLKNISKQCKSIYLFHSRDDKVVPFNHVREYNSRIENSKIVELDNRGHINQEHFKELVDLIKKK